jgi:hypothetical protein
MHVIRGEQQIAMAQSPWATHAQHPWQNQEQ